MILVDPDLEPDAGPRASATKRVPHPAPTDRKARVPSARTLARFLAEAQAAVRLRGQVSVLLTTDRTIRRLNRQFRGKDKPTDVLSFPADPMVQKQEKFAGDLAVSLPTALRQSREHGHALAVELKVLILHGLLHLAGFDHERDKGEMARRERLLRRRLGLPHGLIERVGGPTLAAGKSGEDGAGTVSLAKSASRNAGPSAPQRSAQDDMRVRRRRSRPA
jgi:probable rRNA maturation factor